MHCLSHLRPGPCTVEAHGAVYDHPHKGHDRLYIDQNTAVAGIFDGGGGDELGEAIVNKLPDIISSSTDL